jgi:hypothetical protein
VTRAEGRRAQVLSLILQSQVPLDDDQIAEAVPMNRVYVNAICRQLAQDGLIARARGSDGKIVNYADSRDQRPADDRPDASPDPSHRARGPRRRSSDQLADRPGNLIAGFDQYVAAFESRQAFRGPSLYFHQRSIDRRREHPTVASLLDDTLFLEYVYAVLPAWGMHRMGQQKAKVGDFVQITTSLREAAPALEQLWPLRITELEEHESKEAAAVAWGVIAQIRVSTSRTQIVAGSKFLHHLLPDLVAPIDRRYTFNFFTGQTSVPSDRAAFHDWFPQLAAIGRRCREPIQKAIVRKGFMATGEAKVIDNAIMGFMQLSAATKPSDLTSDYGPGPLPTQLDCSGRLLLLTCRDTTSASQPGRIRSAWRANCRGCTMASCGREVP